jgi:hypothetical protein
MKLWNPIRPIAHDYLETLHRPQIPFFHFTFKQRPVLVVEVVCTIIVNPGNRIWSCKSQQCNF